MKKKRQFQVRNIKKDFQKSRKEIKDNMKIKVVHTLQTKKRESLKNIINYINRALLRILKVWSVNIAHTSKNTTKAINSIKEPR